MQRFSNGFSNGGCTAPVKKGVSIISKETYSGYPGVLDV
jgi:hypothetical protein